VGFVSPNLYGVPGIIISIVGFARYPLKIRRDEPHYTDYNTRYPIKIRRDEPHYTDYNTRYPIKIRRDEPH
jgi:hypothetical protein